MVGARMINSADSRQFRSSRVIIIAAAMVDFECFLGMIRLNSLISLRPDSASYAPNTEPAKSITHGAQASPIVGEPGASTILRWRITDRPASASSGNSGGQGISDSPFIIRSSQSGHAVVHSIYLTALSEGGVGTPNFPDALPALSCCSCFLPFSPGLATV